MVHPNILGPFLLFVLPIFLAHLVGAKHWAIRVFAGLVCLCGYAGLIGTMSRFPIGVAGLQGAAVLACLVVMRGISLRPLAGALSFVGIAGVLASAYFVDEIAQRITGDLGESISFRADYNRVALEIWREHPLLGIGLNNFVEGLEHTDPKLATIVDEMQEGRTEYGIRAAAPVHNLFLLVLAETGLLGLAAFLALLFIALSIAWKSARTATGSAQLVCIGIAIGFAGQYLQQTMDFSMWMDPGLFTFVLLFVLASQPPASGEPWAGPIPAPPVPVRSPIPPRRRIAALRPEGDLWT
jgi:O-antigen ligase